MRLLIRCVLALSVVVLGLTMVMGDAPTVRANLEHCDGQPTYLNGFGGGGGYCPPEYSTCEDEDGDGCFDIDIGGGGGGDWQPPIYDDCGTNLGFQTTGGWSVNDYGLCSTQRLCTTLRDRYNQGLPDDVMRAYCWRSNTAPETSGRHLVVAIRSSCGGTGQPAVVAGWLVIDLGRCGTVEICYQRRNALNQNAGDGATTPRAYCWNSATEPQTEGQHLVFARPDTTTTTTTTTTSTTIPTTTPPTTIRPPRDIDPEIVWVS